MGLQLSMFAKFKQKIKKETGNTIILFLIMVPFMLGMFGIAVDAIIFVNAKNSMQSALDSASVVYASQTKDARYAGSYIQIYKNNLETFKGFFFCDSTPCGNTPTVTSNGANSFTLSVTEKINFIFIDNAGPILNAIAPNSQETVDALSYYTATSTSTIR